DKFIESLIETLKESGFYDDTAIAITTDHGNYKAPMIFDLEPFFHQKGLKPYNPTKGSGDFDANLGGVGFFNFKGDTWFHHPTLNQMKKYKTSGIGNIELDLFEILWEIPGVKLMYYKDDANTDEKGIIYLERRDIKKNRVLKGRIEYQGTGKSQKTRYIFDDEDLFGYINNEIACTLLDSKFHTIDEWVSKTFQTEFVNIIDQLPRYFKNPRSCDIMISTEGDYNFNYEHGKTKGISPYSHDIASKTSMLVPLIIGGSPEIPHLELKHCKTTDIVPTLLDLLGIKPYFGVIGKSLLTNK
ncbi:MAG: hypothetical protein ACFFG0_46845, partial [Candidatus Thorarchaeota archaeon]